jgi:hypothetical protein
LKIVHVGKFMFLKGDLDETREREGSLRRFSLVAFAWFGSWFKD